MDDPGCSLSDQKGVLMLGGVLAVPGNYFFFGLEEYWKHQDECIRINYSGDEGVVRRGIEIIAQEVKRAYSGK